VCSIFTHIAFYSSLQPLEPGVQWSKGVVRRSPRSGIVSCFNYIDMRKALRSVIRSWCRKDPRYYIRNPFSSQVYLGIHQRNIALIQQLERQLLELISSNIFTHITFYLSLQPLTPWSDGIKASSGKTLGTELLTASTISIWRIRYKAWSEDGAECVWVLLKKGFKVWGTF